MRSALASQAAALRSHVLLSTCLQNWTFQFSHPGKVNLEEMLGTWCPGSYDTHNVTTVAIGFRTNLQSRRFQTLYWSSLAQCQKYRDLETGNFGEWSIVAAPVKKMKVKEKTLLSPSLPCNIKYFSNPQSSLTLRAGIQTNPGCVVITWL